MEMASSLHGYALGVVARVALLSTPSPRFSKSSSGLKNSINLKRSSQMVFQYFPILKILERMGISVLRTLALLEKEIFEY
jgi:hypothetical protein